MSLYDRLVPAEALRWPTRCDVAHPTARAVCSEPWGHAGDHYATVVQTFASPRRSWLPWRKRR